MLFVYYYNFIIIWLVYKYLYLDCLRGNQIYFCF